MTTRTLRKPQPVKANDGDSNVPNPKTLRDEPENSIRVARVDQAHRSGRGHRGGNFGKRK